MQDQTIYIIFFALFCIGNLAVGAWAARKLKKNKGTAEESYFLGGKATPVLVMAMAYCAASVSAGSFVGDPGLMSQIGWPYYWYPVFLGPGLVIPAIFLIRKLRLQSEKYGALSITEYVGSRYKSNKIKLYLSVMMVICYLFMLVSQYKGAAILLEMYTGVDFSVGLIIMTVLVVIFVNMGGLNSVAWVSFWQGCFMVFLAGAMILMCLSKAGWFTGLETSLSMSSPDLLTVVHKGSDAIIPWYAVPCVFLFTFFVMFSQPYLSSRYLGLASISRKEIGTFLLITLVVTCLFNMMLVTGLVGKVFFPDSPADYLTITMSIEFFPPVVSGIIMIGFFSAILSTAASILLVVGQSIGTDIYAHLYKKATQKQTILVTQISCVVVAVLILVFNFINTPEFLQLFVLLSLTGVGSMFCMPLFAGVLWKKARREGAWASVIAGPGSYIIFAYVLDMSWAVSMGLCVIPAAIGMFGTSWLFNKIKGEDQELRALAEI